MCSLFVLLFVSRTLSLVLVPESEFDHFYDMDNPKSWNATATAFSLEFWDPGACQYRYKSYAYSKIERYYIAIPGPDYEDSASGVCGKCMWVESEHAKIEVVVVDECSACPQSSSGPIWGGVDLDPYAFSLIGDMEDDYRTWRAVFDDWLVSTWYGTMGKTETPEDWEYPNGIYSAGPGSWSVTITPKYCSYRITDYEDVGVRIQYKNDWYVEWTFVKSVLAIGKVILTAGDLPALELTVTNRDNVWHNSGTPIEWSVYGNVVTLEIIPLHFPEDAVTIQFTLPAEDVPAPNPGVDYNLGFQFLSRALNNSGNIEFKGCFITCVLLFVMLILY